MLKFYFPGLNSLRFFAALFVLIDHLELFKDYFGLKTNWSNNFSANLGSSGVTIFFVISGFLITFILLKEKENGGINIKYFYFRRILRIWPLYYLIIFLSFFIIPNMNFFHVPSYTIEHESNQSLIFSLYTFLLANVGYVFFPTVAFASILWSVAVEEQFYLIWPLIVKRSKSVIKILIFILLIYLITKLLMFLNVLNFNRELATKLYDFSDRTRFSSLMIGGIGAYLIHKKMNFVYQFLFDIKTQILCYFLFILILSNIFHNMPFLLCKNEILSF